MMPLLLLLLLPDDLLSALVSEWIDPERDLRLVAEEVLGLKPFQQLVAQRGVRVRATKVLSDLEWMRAHAVPVELWKTDGPFQLNNGHKWLCNGKRHRERSRRHQRGHSPR